MLPLTGIPPNHAPVAVQDNNSFCSLQCKMEGSSGEALQPGTPMGFLPSMIKSSSPPEYSDLHSLSEQKIG